MAGPRIDILTLFPALLEPFLQGSLLGAARSQGVLDIRVCDIRDFATDRHRSVDDSPYGGGDGMVLKCEPVVAAVEKVSGEGARVLAMSPRGALLDQARVEELANEEQLVLLCGRYAGFDERILAETGAEELSIGDYVLSGGEIPAMVLIEGLVRLLPGVLGNPESIETESFRGGDFLEGPQYTRPPIYRGLEVPLVLRSGNHAAIEEWHREHALARTRARRPDLLDRAGGSGFSSSEIGGSKPNEKVRPGDRVEN